MYSGLKKFCAALLLAGSTLCAAADAPTPPPESKLTPAQAEAEKIKLAGDGFMEANKPGDALPLYKQAVAKDPNNEDALYNGGLAAYLTADFKTAAEMWKALKARDLDDWHLRAKLVQTYQALNDLKARDAERADLFALRGTTKDDSFKKVTQYCREQFSVGATKLMAFEFFELTGEHAMRYRFAILDESGKKEAWYISLGSYDVTNQVAHETGDLKPGERLFHLDSYAKGGDEHKTYDMFKKEPTYEETRAMVVKILEGKLPAKSGTTKQP